MKRVITAAAAGLAAVLVVVVALGAASRDAAAGGSPTVTIDSATVAVGSSGTVALQALNMADPGLGAWSINVVYDPTTLEIQGCAPDNGSVCNPDFAADTVRITGAAAMGLIGDSVLAELTFRCSRTGESALSIVVDTLADGTPGDPQDIDESVVDGAITCIVPPTPTDPPPPPPPGGGGGNGFPAAGGTYVGTVPGEGTVTVVIEPNGQGISSIRIHNLVTVCGTMNNLFTFDPPLDIDEPDFFFALGTSSEGTAFLSISGFFAEDGTIPIDLIIDTTNVDFPGDASPCSSENQVVPLILRRQSESTSPPPPPAGGGTRGGTSGGGLPNAGTGDAFGIDAQSPLTWLVAGLVGAGIAWLSAGVAGAGLAAVTASPSNGEASRKSSAAFHPRMQPVRSQTRRHNQPQVVVRSEAEYKAARARASLAEAMKTQPPQFRPPRRPDRS
jgi:hypothetical protein